MQPFDYRIAVQDPLQMALAGYQQGQQFQQQRVQGERETQLYNMEMQQYQANQAKLQEEQARAKQVQANLADMFERVDTGTLPEGYIGRFLAENPEVGEQTAAYLQGISEEQKMTGVRDQTRLLMMLNNEPGTPSEDSQVAMLLKERKAAAEAAGKPDQAAAAEASLMEYLNSPAALKASLMTNIAIGSPEAWKVIEPLVVKKAPEAASSAGKVIADYNANMFGEVGSPEAIRIRDEQLAKAGGGTSVSVTVPGGIEEGAFEKKVGELQATSIEAIAQQGQTSRRNRQTINLLERALTGAPAGIEAGLKGLAVNFGIETEGSDQIEVAKALISQLVPGQRPPGSGTMSDADLQLFKDSLPKLMGTSEGRLKIVANMKAISDYMIAEGDLADAVLDGTISRAQYRERVRALGNPLAEYSSGATTGRGSVLSAQEAAELERLEALERGGQ
jgi:hypothetical protein